MGTNALEYSTNFHSYDIVKADFFQLVRLEVANSHSCFQSPIRFHLYLDSVVHIFSTSENDHALFI